MEKNNERKKYLDSIRFIAIFIVFVTHYINRFGEPYRRFFHDFPSSVFLYGISGKMGVAILAVIMGKLAYRTKRSFSSAVCHRYIFFLVSVFFINAAYVIWNHFSVSQNPDAIGFLKAGVLMESTYFPALWFIRDFFIAYIISILNQRAKVKLDGVLLEILILLIFSEVWIAVCLLGNVASILEESPLIKRLSQHRYLTVFLLILGWGMTKIPAETDCAFVAYGMSCVILVLVNSYSDRIRRVFDVGWLAWLGRYSWGFFLVHALVYNMIGTRVFHLEEYVGTEGYRTIFTGCFVLCTICNILLSVPVTRGLNWLTNRVDMVLRYFGKAIIQSKKDEV